MRWWKEKEKVTENSTEGRFYGYIKANGLLSLRFTFHVEGCIMALQEQELKTEETLRPGDIDIQQRCIMDAKCRVCGQSNESVYHLVGSCLALAFPFYLNERHNQKARILHQILVKSDSFILNPPEIAEFGDQEIWYGVMIKTTPKSGKTDQTLLFGTRKKCSAEYLSIQFYFTRILRKLLMKSMLNT